MKPLRAASRRPELVIVGKLLQRLLVAGRFEPRKNPAEYRVADRRGVPDVKVDRVQPVLQVQFGIVVQRAAVKPFVAVGDPPADQVTERIVVKVQFDRDRIIEAEVLGMDHIALQEARTEGDDFSVLAPDEETVLVAHPLAEAAKVFLGQFLEMQVRPVIDLQIERIDLVDDRRDVVDDAHFDRRRPLRCF